MKQARRTAVAVAMVAAGVVGLGTTAHAAGLNGQSYCSGASGPDGVVDPTNPATWNSPGEVISFVAPEQVVAGGRGSVGAVATFCNPNIFTP